MTYLEQNTSLLADIDGCLQRIHELAVDLRRGRPEVEVWQNHFLHIWRSVEQSLGWWHPVGRRAQAMEYVARLIDAPRDRIAPLVFSSPILEQDGLELTLPPNRTLYTTDYGFKLYSSGIDMWQPLATGHYYTELCETLVLLRLLPFVEAFVDVGANIGFYSLLVASQTKPPFHNTAIEPFTANFESLQMGIRANGFGNHVTPLKVAVGGKKGAADLHLCRLGSGGHSLAGLLSENQQGTEVVTVNTLDNIRAENQWPDRPTLVKIDVEGGEEEVLKGATSWLQSPQAPILLFESWPTGGGHQRRRSQATIDFVKALGYALFKIKSPTQGGSPITPLTLAAEKSPTGNYLALPPRSKGLIENLDQPADFRVFSSTKRLAHLKEFARRSLDGVRRYTAAQEMRVSQ